MTSHAQWDFDNRGSRTFDMRKNDTNKSTVTIRSVNKNDVKKECDAYSRKVGNNGFNYEPLACAFWQDNKCTIIVPHLIDMRTIGHEVMHCFQGGWHD